MVELSTRNIKELREINFHLIYKLDVVIGKELLLAEGEDGDQLNKVEEGLNLFFKKGLNFAKKAYKNKTVRNIARELIEKAPDAIEGLSKKVKNKNLKKILDSDIARTGVNFATGLALDKLQ